MRFALIATTLLLSMTEAAQACPVPSRAPSSDACAYMNFVVFRDFPNYERPEGLAADEILREAEDVFAAELERAGFHRVADGETPWLFLRAVLQSSSLKSDAVSGIVEFGPRSNLHRELAIAPASGSNASPDIGMIAVIEASTQSSGSQFRANPELQELARANALDLRDRTYPVLSALCKWRTELLLDGLTPNGLRERLVDGMDRIRRVHRNGMQQKGLKLEVEPR